MPRGVKQPLLLSVLIAVLLFAAGTAVAPAQQAADESEKEIERYRAMISDPMSNPGLSRRRSRRSAVEDAARRQQRLARGLRPRRRAGQARGRLRQAAALFRRCRPGDGPRAAAAVVHAERPGSRHQGRGGAPVSAARPHVRHGGPGRLHRQQVERHEDRAPARPSKGAGDGRRRRGDVLPPRRRRWTSACATCHGDDGKRIRLQGLPNLSKPGKEAQETMGAWPTYRVSQSESRTMQHRLWDCYRQMRMPVPEYGSDGLTALHGIPEQASRGGRDQRSLDQALREERAMKKLALTCLPRYDGRPGACSDGVANIPPRRSMLRSWTPTSRRRWKKRPPKWQARVEQDETQRLCSLYRNNPPSDAFNKILAREKATVVFPADGKRAGRLEAGRESCAERPRRPVLRSCRTPSMAATATPATRWQSRK